MAFRKLWLAVLVAVPVSCAPFDMANLRRLEQEVDRSLYETPLSRLSPRVLRLRTDTETKMGVDTFKHTAMLSAPLWAERLPLGRRSHPQNKNYKCFLRSGFDFPPRKAMWHQLYIQYQGRAWAFLDSAYMEGGKKLPATVIAREVCHGGGVVEHMGIAMTASELSLGAEAGIVLRVYGSNGNVDVAVPASYIAGYLDRVRRCETQANTPRSTTKPSSD